MITLGAPPDTEAFAAGPPAADPAPKPGPRVPFRRPAGHSCYMEVVLPSSVTRVTILRVWLSNKTVWPANNVGE